MSANELKAKIKELIDTEDVDYLNVVFKPTDLGTCLIY
jgi:hypothetical protein